MWIKIVMLFKKHNILLYILRNTFFVTNYGLSVNAKKKNCLY